MVRKGNNVPDTERRKASNLSAANRQRNRKRQIAARGVKPATAKAPSPASVRAEKNVFQAIGDELQKHGNPFGAVGEGRSKRRKK